MTTPPIFAANDDAKEQHQLHQLLEKRALIAWSRAGYPSTMSLSGWSYKETVLTESRTTDRRVREGLPKANMTLVTPQPSANG